jgi:hypothetical protein
VAQAKHVPIAICACITGASQRKFTNPSGSISDEPAVKADRVSRHDVGQDEITYRLFDPAVFNALFCWPRSADCRGCP